MIISIKDRGLIFNFKGKEYRTPLKLEISDRDLNQVMFSLKKSGISKFKILKGLDLEINEQKRIDSNIEKPKKENLTLELILEYINKRFDILEEFLKNKEYATNNNPEFSVRNDDDIKKHKIPPYRRTKIIDQSVEEFIPTPSIDFEGKIKNVIDSSKIDIEKINEAIKEYDHVKFKRGGFSK